MYPYIITDNSVTIIKGGVLSTTSANPNFNGILDAIKAGDWDRAVELISPRVAIENYAGTSITIDGERILRNGIPVDNAVVPHIMTMRAKGFDIQPLMHFLDKVLRNPSMRSRNQIWRFVSANQIPITQDGDLLFYKRVKDDYYDVHTGKTHMYAVGSEITMPRHNVDDDPESTCSHGLHVCSYEYLKSFGGDRTVLCKVDPADIVSVPIDYENTKVRVCRLVVTDELHDVKPMDTGVYKERQYERFDNIEPLDDEIPF